MSSSFFTLLFKPFERTAGIQALALGLTVLLAQSVLAYFLNAQFDGLLNLHFGEPHTLYTVGLQVLINWLSIALCFYLFALIFKAKNLRLIDVFGTSALAFAPLIVGPLLNGQGYFSKISKAIAEKPFAAANTIAENNPVFFALSSVLLLLLIVWHVALLYNAFKISTNLKKSKLISGFILSLLFASIISTILTRII